MVRIFIYAPFEARFENVVSYSRSKTQNEILRYMRKEDKRRAAYYHYYTGEDWRDVSGYDICLDSSRLGEDGCVERICSLLNIF